MIPSTTLARFAAPWSRSLAVTTALAGALIVLVALGVAVLLRRSPSLAALAFLAVVVPLPLAWALAPKGFVVDASALVVERPLLPLRVARAEIRSARALGADEARRAGLSGGALRTFGTSGLFGHYGRFRSPSLGGFRMYATRGDGFVLVETAHGPLVLTPDDPERLCAELARPAGAGEPRTP